MHPRQCWYFETLSKILPDQTYVTELQLEGNKLRLTGITRDAPSLIGLIEQSGDFTRATFFAPTTRSASKTGDRFHIEAVIKLWSIHMISRSQSRNYLTRHPNLGFDLRCVNRHLRCDDPVPADGYRGTVSGSQCLARNTCAT